MNIFTYGSLMFPDARRRVTGRHHPSAPATLADHAAWKVRGQTYPGLSEAPGQTTEGFVYFDVGPDAAARLDEFEGPFYTRTTVSVKLADSVTVAAEVYLVHEGFRGSLSNERWDVEDFRTHHLGSFLGPERTG